METIKLLVLLILSYQLTLTAQYGPLLLETT